MWSSSCSTELALFSASLIWSHPPARPHTLSIASEHLTLHPRSAGSF